MKAILQSGRLLGLAVVVLAGGNLLASPPCTAISYQGRLQQSGSPANGLYDFQFSLWDAVSSGTLVGATQAVSGMTVSNGLFDVQLDFGPDPFCGSALWLEVGVRTNLGGAFTVLSPRQPLLPTPYAIMANTASNLSGPLPAAQLTGTLPPSALAGYAGGVTFTNPASSFIGTFTGNGGGLSNLAGAAIQPGTLNSNKFDAGTAAQLALAGTPCVLPFVSLVATTNGQFLINGTPVTNSQTAGWNEALALLLGTAGGGPRNHGGNLFASGDFPTTASIVIPSGTNLCSVTLQGSGKTATEIQFVGTVIQAVLSVRANDVPGNYLSFTMRDMAVTTLLNGCTNIVELLGANPPGHFGDRGFESANIERCLIRYGTNRDNWWGTSPDNTSLVRNLVGFYLDAGYNDIVNLRQCSIFHCAQAISWASDWGSIEDNSLSFNGANEGATLYTNNWPKSSPYSVGGGVCLREPSIGSLNAHNLLWISGNEHVGSYPHFNNIIDPTFGSAWGAGDFTIYGDGDEGRPAGSLVPLTVTAGHRITFVDPVATQWVSGNYFTNYWLPSTTDFTAWNTRGCPTNMVGFIDALRGTNNGPYGFAGPVTAQTFISTGAGALTCGTNAAPADPTTRVWVVITNGVGGATFAFPAAKWP